MCGGSREIQSRRPPRLAQEMKPNMPHVAADGALLITSCPRRQPAAAGLAIVAALEAELVQSGSATTANKAAESAPPSPTSPLPAMPIPIAASAQEEITEAGYTVKNHSRGAQRSIFSTSLSPPSTSFMMSCNLHNIREPNDDFLGVCFFCKRPLGPGKDIYMYRGDRAFCSTECRHKHIITDESLLCKVQINQQCVQASCPTNQSKFTPSITIPVLV